MRVIGIDIFSITLALLIFMFHYCMHFGCDYYYLTNFVSLGAIAMTGFFLLSCYSLLLAFEIYLKKKLIHAI